MTAGKTNLGQLLNHLSFGRDDNRQNVFAPVLVETSVPYVNAVFGCPYVDNTALLFGQIQAATNSVPMVLIGSMGDIISQQVIDGTSFHPDSVRAAVVHRVENKPEDIKILVGGGSGYDSFIALFNGDASLDKAFKLHTPSPTLQNSVVKALYYDKYYYVVGVQAGPGTPMTRGFIIKLDDEFTVISAKEFGASTGTSFTVEPFDAMFNAAGQLVISALHTYWGGSPLDIGVYVFDTSLTNVARVEVDAGSITPFGGIEQLSTGSYIIAGRTPNQKVELYSIASNLATATHKSHIASGAYSGDRAEPRSLSIMYGDSVVISGFAEQAITNKQRQFVMYLDHNTLNPVSTMYFADDFTDSTSRSFLNSFVDKSQRLLNIGHEGVATTILYTDPYGTSSGCVHIEKPTWVNEKTESAKCSVVSNYAESIVSFSIANLTDISMTATTGFTTSKWCAY